MNKNNLYTENSIVTETPRVFTRRVPSTYLGSSKTNTNLIKEIFANAVDEHAIGHGTQIDVVVDTEKNEYIVEDNGQGFLVNAGIDEEGETILQRSFDKLNTSGKTTSDGVYQGTALGLNGIGAKLTNWLSKSLNVITYRDGEYEELDFKDGLFVKRKVGKVKHESGTKVTWHPDEQFFAENVPDDNMLKSHFEIIAALCPKLTINYTYNGRKTTYSEPDGINAYVERKVKGKELFSNRFIIERSIGKDAFNVCLTYTSDYSENIDAYVNLGHTDAGAHIQAFHTAFTKAVNKYAIDAGLIKKNDKNFNIAEISEGLYVVCNMTTTTAKYDAQNKSRIDDVDAKIINAVIGGDFATWLTKNPNDARIIIDRALTARKAREAAQKAKEKIRDAGKKVKSIFVDLPSKLSDAYPKNKKDRSNCELMVCLKGDTKIKLLNGTTPTIESLVGQTNLWAYSTNNNGAMIPAQIKEVFKTQEVNKTIKICFNDGSFVECTPEHKFLDRDTCTWIEAKNLIVGQSLFSMKTKIDKSGHTKVFIPGGKDNRVSNKEQKFYKAGWESVHVRVAKYLGIAHEFNGVYMDIHHIDFNKLNNDPENLAYITKKEHLAIHTKYNYESERMNYENKHFTDTSRIAMQTAVYKRSTEGIDNQRHAVSKAWADGKYKNATWSNYNSTTRFINNIDNTQRNKYIKRAKKILDAGLELNEQTWHNFDSYMPISWSKMFSNCYFSSVNELIEEAVNYNLTITNIEEIIYDTPISVYCLNIDNDFHSFVLDNGIITHNCEGDSAASAINAVKDSSFQATFPIRGKILNCQKATPDKVYANMEIANITKALGLDVDKTSGKLIYDPKKLRYSKIIIATDADADGSAIATLLCTVFNWLCPELFKNGHIYRVYGALYKITFKDGTYKLFQNDEEFDSWKKSNSNAKYTVSRAKGLGELTQDETFEQLVNPSTRNLKRLEISDYDNFEKYLEIFEGASVNARKEFYETGIIPETL